MKESISFGWSNIMEPGPEPSYLILFNEDLKSVNPIKI